jgi:hypothetical protein
MNFSKIDKVLIAFSILVTLMWIANCFYPFIWVKIYFYFKNGQIVETEHYKVTLPFLQWKFYGKGDIAYIISADKDNIAEIAIDCRNVEIDYLLKQCTEVQQSNKSYQYVSGTEYLCKTNDYNTLYFLSDDGFFFFRAFPYEVNKKNSALYKALFDTIQKK